MQRRLFACGKLSWVKMPGVALALYALTATALPAQTFTLLYSFESTDGAYPNGGLTQATDGNLYGTTYGGGVDDGGTIFRITTSGALTTVYDLCTDGGRQCPQNISPRAPLLQATNERFYGSTYGAAVDTAFPGAIFEITGGTVKTLHNFCSRPQKGCPDGLNPAAALVQTASGELYGATEFGGGPCEQYPVGCGTIFKMSPNGLLTTLYSFCKAGGGCPDGAFPLGALVQAANGDFYGTTYQGGSHGGGTIFKISPAGTLTTLDVLCNGSGPCNYEPEAGLVLTSSGDLYGTSYGGGTNGYGTIFKITPDGALTTLYSFCSQAGCADGATPTSALIEATDGNLYGSTSAGGTNSSSCAGGCGTIFQIRPGGTLTTLYRFCVQAGCADGTAPGTIVQDTDGDFYGTASTGGSPQQFGYGTIFRLSSGLGPFVKPLQTSGKVGVAVEILGIGLAGAGSVTFNGTPAATFTVNSTGSAISTTVPPRATTGTVKVTLPGGSTLSSNVPFQVLP
jgi:uncharacterized repeat protein (TIGR03803 family)